GSMPAYVSRMIRRFRTCITGTGRTASVTARSDGGSARQCTGRPVAFVALGQVHRSVRAARRRSGELYERVPALLVLSGQQARVDPAAAGEGEVRLGHDRPILQGSPRE